MSVIKIVNTIGDGCTKDLNAVVQAINEFGITGIIDFEVRNILINLSIDDESWQKLTVEQQQFYRKNLSQQMMILLECRNEIARLVADCEIFRSQGGKV